MIGATAEGVGYLIEGLSKTYTILEAIGDFAKGDIGAMAGKLGELKENTHGASDADNKFADAIRGVTERAQDESKAIEDLNTSLEKLINQNLDADQATIAQKQSVEDLTTSIAKNGKQWDINTDAGRANTTALDEAIRAADRKRTADIANGKDAIQAAQDYNEEVAALLGIAGNAGLAKDKLKAMAGTYTIDIDEIHRRIWADMTAAEFAANPHGLSEGGFAGPGGIIKAAQGLLPPRAPGTLVLAGEPETGGEWMIPRRGISQQRAATLIAGAAADHGLGMGGDGAYLQLYVPLTVDGRQIAAATYEGFVNYGQERKNRRGSTGF
jgi:hypothetical protein